MKPKRSKTEIHGARLSDLFKETRAIRKDVVYLLETQADLFRKLNKLIGRSVPQSAQLSEITEVLQRELGHALTRHLSSLVSNVKSLNDDISEFSRKNFQEGIENLRIENAALRQEKALVLTALGVNHPTKP